MAKNFTTFTPIEEVEDTRPTKFTSFTPIEQALPVKDAGFSPTNLALESGQSLVGATKSIIEGFGAGSGPAEYLEGVSKKIGSYISPERQAEIQRRAALEKQAAASGTTVEELSAGLGGVTEAPVTAIAKGVASSIPTVALSLGAGALGLAIGAPIGIAAAVGIGAKFLIGALQGAGETKGDIYSNIKAGLEAKGMKPEVAAKQAEAAQEYFGENKGNIALSTLLGAAAGGSPVETKLMEMFSKPAVKKIAEKAVEKAVPGFVRRTATDVLKEAVPEGLQAGQGQYAQNVAMTRAGMETPEMQGVLGAAARDALVGGITGAAVSTVAGGPKATKPAEDLTKRASTTAGQEALDIVNAPFTPPSNSPVLSTIEVNVGGKKSIKVTRRDGSVDIDGVQVVPPTVAGGPTAGQEDLDIVNAPSERVQDVEPVINPPVGDSVPVVSEREIVQPPAGAIAPEGVGVGAVVPPVVPVATGAGEQPAALDIPEEVKQDKTLKSQPTYTEGTVLEVPVSELKLSEDVPQFKSDANQAGVVQASKLEGKFDRRLASPIQIWERDNGKLEVISGRHRLDLAQRSGEKTIPAQVYKESEGFNADMARMLDIELNVKDGRGKVKDYVSFFKEFGLPKDQARSEGLLNTAIGRQAYEIADAGSPSLIAAHFNKEISDDAATSIAINAPKDDALQNLGMAQVKDGKSINHAVNFMRSAMAAGFKGQEGSGDLFGFDDSFAKEAEAVTKEATKQQRDARQQLSAIKGAAKSPEKAKLGGVDVKNLEQTKAKIAELEKTVNDLENFHTNPELYKKLRQDAGLEEGLTSPTPKDLKAAEDRAASVEKNLSIQEKAADDKAKADAEVGEFGLTGSDRVADADPNQEAMFSLRGKSDKQITAFEQSLRTLLSKFGLKDVGLKLSEGMRDEGSYAAKLIQIAADSANPIRTLRHEAVHALRELGFFTDAQWKSLSKMAKDKWIDQYLKQRNVDGKPLKVGEESRYDAYMREYKGDMEKITEEAVADAFADFDATKPPAGMIQAILQKLRNLFQSIKSALTKMESAEQIFGKVEKGALKPEGKQVKGESKSLRDRATANFNRWFGDSKVVDKNGKPLVVYHGTNKNQQGDAFTQFDTYGSNYGLMGQGSYFTDNADLASSYTKKGRGDTPTVYPVYLSIKNPINMDARGNEAAWQKAFPDVDFNEYSPEGVKNEDYFRAVEEYLTDQQIPRYEGAEAMQDGLRSMGHDGITHRGGARFKTAVGESNTRHQVFIAFDPNQIKSAIGNNGDYSLTNADIRKNLRSQAGKEKSSTEEGQAALNITGGLGRISEPELSLLEQGKKFAAERKEIINDAIENPKATIAEAKATAVRSSDKFQTKTFSSDAAINNSINRSVNEFIKDNAEKIGIMLEISQSQVFHADGVATGVMKEGNAVYNKELRKYEIKKDDANLPALFKQIGVIKDKYGLTQAQAELIGHTAFEAKRLKSLVEFNNKVDQEVEAMREEADKLSMGAMQDLINPLADQSGKEAAANALREKANRRFKDKKLIHNMSGTDNQSAGAEISAGNKLFKIIPELNGVVDTWNKMRENIAEIMKDSGLWSEEEVEFLLSNTDYVPFMREDQLEKGKGPKENIRGLMVEAREKKLKGSHRPVNDVFDNMSRWMQYSVNRAVRNRSALALIDTANRFGQAERVKNKSDGENVVRVWRGGKEEFYSMADPYFVDAFTGLESVAIPVWELGTKVANFLRQSIVLNPLFTVAQLPQDSFAAMFTSGLKPQFALQIPARAVKEFAKTLFNRSATNNELKKYGVVGVRDFNAQTARLDAQVYAGMKSAPGIVGKLKNILEHIAMSGDNAVRQATYEAAILQGLSKAEAIEKSFEIWNIRRKGSNPQLAMASQLIPFFGAYLTAQNVALKTITLKSTSPTERNAALGALIGTTASVMTLSLLYSILNGDDEEYLDKPAAIRDRMLMVPGTGGFGIPLRSDLFSIPKIITEHMYLMITDKGYEDGRKFRDSMVNALTNSFFSPTVVPQLIKPGVEVFTNYNFFQGRPLIGEYQKRIEKEFQFNESTSEIAKILGKTGLVSPISVDHLIKGMFGSVGGLVIYMTNPLLHSDPNVEKPTMSTRDMLATIPGASSFISKEKESGLKNDFYVLRDEVEKVTNTLSNLKQRSPEKIAEYIADPDVMAKLTVSKGVQGIDKKLGEIRKAMTRISNLPTSVMDSDEKQQQIKQLREAETTMLKAINVKKLREMAKI